MTLSAADLHWHYLHETIIHHRCRASALFRKHWMSLEEFCPLEFFYKVASCCRSSVLKLKDGFFRLTEATEFADKQ